MNGNKGGVDLCLGGLHHIQSLSGGSRSPTLILSRLYSQLPKSWAHAPTFVEATVG
jgi:hypothetical protein